MIVFLKRNRIMLLGVIIGSLCGWLYWHQIGCASGTCPITSSPINSSIYGAVMGGLLLSIFRK